MAALSSLSRCSSSRLRRSSLMLSMPTRASPICSRGTPAARATNTASCSRASRSSSPPSSSAPSVQSTWSGTSVRRRSVAMAWFNIVVIVLLAKPGIATLRDYEAQRKMGLDPVFIPSRCGIEGAELWNTIIPRTYAKELAALKAKLALAGSRRRHRRGRPDGAGGVRNQVVSGQSAQPETRPGGKPPGLVACPGLECEVRAVHDATLRSLRCNPNRR